MPLTVESREPGPCLFPASRVSVGLRLSHAFPWCPLAFSNHGALAATISAPSPSPAAQCISLAKPCLPHLERLAWPWALCCRGPALLWRPPSLTAQDSTCHPAAGNFVPFVIGIFKRESKAGVSGHWGATAPVIFCLPTLLSPGAGWVGGRWEKQPPEAPLAGPQSFEVPGPSLGGLFSWIHRPSLDLTSAPAPRHACLQPSGSCAPGADIL